MGNAEGVVEGLITQPYTVSSSRSPFFQKFPRQIPLLLRLLYLSSQTFEGGNAMTIRQFTWSDKQIMASLLNPADHRRVFSELYRQLFPAVRKHVTQQGGSVQDAEDVFQEGVLALWKNARSGRYEVRNNAKLSTYLIEICKRRWIDMQKKASRRYETQPETLPQMGEESIMADWIAREDRQAFQQKFARLGEKCREVLTLFYYEKLSLKEIAAKRGIGEASMKNEKYRCMQRLRGLFA